MSLGDREEQKKTASWLWRATYSLPSNDFGVLERNPSGHEGFKWMLRGLPFRHDFVVPRTLFRHDFFQILRFGRRGRYFVCTLPARG